MSEGNKYGLGGSKDYLPKGTLDFDPNAKIQDKSFITENIINKDIKAPPIDVGYDDPAFETDLMAKLSTKGMIEYNKLNNKKLQNEATDGLTPAPTPEELDRLNELEIQKNEAALNTTAIV